MESFQGRWVLRNGIRVPVPEPERPKVLCKVCGSPSPAALCRPCRDSSRERVHGSHAGYAQHVRRHEKPCQACSEAEKVYQGKRYRKGSLSKVDLAWCEKNAVKFSWTLDTRTNRDVRISYT